MSISYGRIMSNAGAGMQRIFGAARTQIGRAAKGMREVFHEPGVKPYSKMTPAERLAHDADMWEMDHKVMEKYNKKMTKKHGPDWAEKFSSDFDDFIGGS